MSVHQITKCDMDGCGEQKGSVNHWFTLWIEHGVFHSAGLGTVDFDDEKKLVKVDACGIEHAQKFYARFMDNGTFHPSASTEDPGGSN